MSICFLANWYVADWPNFPNFQSLRFDSSASPVLADWAVSKTLLCGFVLVDFAVIGDHVVQPIREYKTKFLFYFNTNHRLIKKKNLISTKKDPNSSNRVFHLGTTFPDPITLFPWKVTIRNSKLSHFA